MCVIMFKPANREWPSLEELREMQQANPDGMGLMYPRGQLVLGKKFLPSQYMEFLQTIFKLPITLPVVLHFRLATHGALTKGCCHPFPFPVRKKKELRKEMFLAPIGMMHNGVISGFGAIGGKESDTQEFLHYLSRSPGLVTDVVRLRQGALELVERFSEGKWAVMNGKGEVRLLGTFTKIDKRYYSNRMFKLTSWKDYDWDTFGTIAQEKIHEMIDRRWSDEAEENSIRHKVQAVGQGRVRLLETMPSTY